MNGFTYNDELCHHGIKGQKWGIRRYQNSDGSLTTAGRSRYGYGQSLTKAGVKAYAKEYRKLQKLKKKADLDQQAADYQKYMSRFKKSAGFTATLGAAALANKIPGAKIAANLFNKSILDSKKIRMNQYDEATKEAERVYQQSRKWAEENKQALKEKGLWDQTQFDDNDFRAHQWNKATDAYNKANASDYQHAEKRYLEANRAATTALSVATGISAGVTAYNGIKAAMAKARMSEAGHAKAVAKYEAQAKKMLDTFGEVKLSEVIKK